MTDDRRRAAEKDETQVINVQTEGFREHTTLIKLEQPVRIQR